MPCGGKKPGHKNKRTRTGVVAATELPTKASFQTSHVSSHHGYSICLCSRTRADTTTERSQGKKLTQLRSVIPQNYEILIIRLLFQLWNKIFILWQDKKIKTKIFSPFGLPSPHILHCVSFPKSRNTCSTIRSNIPLASTRQFLKDAIPSSSQERSHGA